MEPRPQHPVAPGDDPWVSRAMTPVATVASAGSSRPALAPRTPAAGLTYPRLASAYASSWWRSLGGTVLLDALHVVGLIVVLAPTLGIAYLAGASFVDGWPADPLLSTAADLISIAVGLPAVLLAARWVQRRPGGTVASVTGRPRWRWQLRCLVLAALAVVALFLVSAALSAVPGVDEGEELFGWVGWRAFLPAALVLLVTVPLQAAAEEYVFRGWFVQAFGARLRSPWPGAVVSALLFAAAHGYSQLAGFVDLVLFALVLTWLTARTGGLEAAVGFHVVNNLVVFLLGASAGQLEGQETPADAPWLVLVADGVALAVYAALVLRFAARRSDLDVRSPGETDEAPGVSPTAIVPSRADE